MDVSALKQFAIKEGASEESLVKRALTWDEVSQMGEAESHWHCVANSKAVDAVHESHSKEAQEAFSHAGREVRKVANYDVSDVPALANLMIENGQKFSDLFPQFVTSRKNTDRVLKYMKDNSMLPEVESFVQAFQALAHAGEISIDASKTGLTDDSTELTGERLQEHPNLAHLLTRVTPQLFEQRSVMRMSESNFKTWQRQKEGPPEVPPMIKARINTAFVMFASMCPEFSFNDKNKTKLLAYLNDHATNVDFNTIKLAYDALKKAGELDINENVIVRGEYGTVADYSQVENNKHLTDRQETLKYKITAVRGNFCGESTSVVDLV